MYPIFITDDPDARVEIPSLLGQCRWGVNRLDEFLVRWRGCRVLFVRRATVRLLPPFYSLDGAQLRAGTARLAADMYTNRVVTVLPRIELILKDNLLEAGTKDLKGCLSRHKRSRSAKGRRRG